MNLIVHETFPMKRLVRLSPRAITCLLLKIVALLLTLGLLSIYLHFVRGYETAFGFVPLFDLDGEYNIPAFYSALAIWSSSILLWQIYHYKRQQGNGEAHYWKVLCFVFVYLGLDEMASLHENFGRLAPLVWKLIPSLTHSRKWIAPFLPLLGLFAFYFLPFYLRLDHRTRLRLTLAGLVYVSGAIGVELLGAWYADQHQLPVLVRALFSALEEAMEMVGIVLFIRALLLYWQHCCTGPLVHVELQVSTNEKKAGILTQADETGKVSLLPHQDPLLQT